MQWLKLLKQRDIHKGFPLSRLALLLIASPFALGFLIVLIYIGLVLKDMPDLSSLEKGITESTVILDRNGKELYKLFREENRRYVPLSEISPYMQKAIIAIEDKNFYHHPGIDIMGVLRALVHNAKGSDDRAHGGSTLTQQLVKNLVLKSGARTLDRKFREAILSYLVERQYSKDKILELYLNQVPFGNNAYGIEMAAFTYFNKHAKDLTIAEASILASLPKGPTLYSPYGANKHLLMGYCKNDEEKAKIATQSVATDEDKDKSAKGVHQLTVLAKNRVWIKLVPDGSAQNKQEKTLEKGEQLDVEFKDATTIATGSPFYEVFVDDVKLKTPKERNWSFAMKDLSSRADNPDAVLSAEETTAQYANQGCGGLEGEGYTYGRKDNVLTRMLEEGFISKEERQKAWEEAAKIQFKAYKEKIVHPHFVMFVREYLENKYGEDVGGKGLIVKTTLDSDVQTIAEEVVAKHGISNEKKYGVPNAALVSVEPKTGQILAMVGSRDYWDTAHDGNVNVTVRKRQPGSSFKPLIYAALFEGNYGAGSVLWDVRTKFGSKYPKNFNGQFNGPMKVRNALAYSRNIPAIKAFILAGDEDKVLDFVAKLGFGYLKEFRDTLNATRSDEEKFFYGWPLAIGSGEVRPLDMAAAYGAFASNGIYAKPTPILEVKTRSGEVLEAFKEGENTSQAMDPQVAYQVADILADREARPADGFWRDQLTVKGQIAGAKTGTSTKRYGKGENDVLPSDLWTVGFTRYMSTAVWSGKNDGKALNYRADGIGVASPIWKEFMEKAHVGKEKKAFDKPEGIVQVTVSTLSGKRAGKGTPKGFISSDIFASWAAPKEYDNSAKVIKIDSRNGLLATDDCAPAVTEEIAAFNVHSERPEWKAWEEPVLAWARGKGLSSASGVAVDASKPTDQCKKTSEGQMPEVSIQSPGNLTQVNPGEVPVKIAYKAPIGVSKVEYYVDNTLQNTRTGDDVHGLIRLPYGTGAHTVKVVLYDSNYFTAESQITIKTDVGDAPAPEQSENKNGNTAVTPTPTPTAPTSPLPQVSITKPKAGSVVASGLPVTIALDVQGDKSNFQAVEISMGGTVVGTLTDTLSLTTPMVGKPGVVSITATTIGKDGSRKATSTTITVPANTTEAPTQP